MVLIKSICMVVVFCGIVACLLLSYTYLIGDREDREDMQLTAAHLIERVHPNPLHEASLSSLEPTE